MSDTSIPSSGFYQILVVKPGERERELGGEALTRQDENEQVTIRPVGAPGVNPSDQVWFVRPETDGNVIITKDPDIRPPLALTYEGEPAEPKSGTQVVTRRQHGRVTKWHVGIAPGHRHDSLRVAGSDLGIAMGNSESPRPRSLVLGKDNQLAVYFKPAHRE